MVVGSSPTFGAILLIRLKIQRVRCYPKRIMLFFTLQLKFGGINAVEEVFFAKVQADGSLYIDGKEDKMMN
ncbi:hypothetical protein [Ureibacillus sinduriensis]|uniref:hypothetical protein n=1 Tax=Ureibacillus sinduriensis TaxID=561440 RepID=UPI001C0070B2|nr:hypothetical protein [Ureibacillus sinduriensis]